MVTGYNRTGALVCGIIEVCFGLVCFALQIPLFIQNLPIAIYSIGLWAGALYIIIGCVTIGASIKPTPCLVKASLTLSVFGILVSAGAIGVAVYFWGTTSNWKISFQDENADAEFKMSSIMTLAIAAASFVLLFMLLTGAILGCEFIGCCARRKKDTSKSDHRSVLRPDRLDRPLSWTYYDRDSAIENSGTTRQDGSQLNLISSLEDSGTFCNSLDSNKDTRYSPRQSRLEFIDDEPNSSGRKAPSSGQTSPSEEDSPCSHSRSGSMNGRPVSVWEKNNFIWSKTPLVRMSKALPERYRLSEGLTYC